jgi:hypothetical protein
MLRASAHAIGQAVDLHAVTGMAVDPLLPAGRQLLDFASALLRGTDDELAVARKALDEAAGSGAVVRAAAVTGNFQMMNRLVDATGVPIGASLRSIAPDLGLDG